MNILPVLTSVKPKPNQTQTALNLLVDALATYRVSRLIIDDNVTEELRAKAYEQAEKLPTGLANKVTYLLGCYWCVGMYAAAVVLLVRRYAPDLADYLNTLLAASAVTGAISERL